MLDRAALNAPQTYLEEPKYPVDNDFPEAVPTASDKQLSEPPENRIATTQRKICGCAPTLFFTLALVILLLTGAAIGGGVGSSISAKHTAAATATTTTTVTKTVAATTPTTTGTGNATAAFYFTLHASTSFTGASYNVTRPGNYTLPWRARSYVWKQQGSDCCAVFCRGGADVGYRCGETTYQTDVSGGGVDAVGVQCGAGGTVGPPGGWCG
ncbi:uncharacterized protein LTHEOB_12736 [Neofusicoccum parvum]|uniref:Uncharacterized protein LTHEOB_12736 n=1 Tax=Neofusicoccum parvum TaxID=310453 RepID=A0ACB5SMU6_9PEZI|nr:uncharacterized protein LTHEOB_12736 [Neofusicoccum parvum]